MVEWRDIPGYEGYYQVSNLGDIRSVTRVVIRSDGVNQIRNGRSIPKKMNNDGYLIVRLSKDAKRKQFGVHVLVALAFVPGYFDGAEVNHRDCDRTNNVPENLEWVTHADNIKHTIACGNHITQTRSMAGESNPNFGNRSLSKRYAEDKKLAKVKQSRPGAKNGRATPVRMIMPSGESFDYQFLSQCAAEIIGLGLTSAKNISCVASCISKSARNGKKYLGCDFMFLT